MTPPITNLDVEGEQLILYAERGATHIGYTVFAEEPLYGLSIFNGSGKELYSSNEVLPKTGEIDVSIYASGVYYFRFFLSGREITKAFIKF
nr:T9SS type A sorting domain-containing protein [Allomuricauda sp.]